jgi:putative DNA primase/helicase
METTRPKPESTAATATRKAKLRAEAERLATPPAAVSHEQVLKELLEQVQPVNFRELAHLDDEKDKLQTSHYVVLVIEEVLKLAARNSWGLCRRQGFLYSYNGAYWKQLDEPTLRQFLRQVAERQGVPAMKARYHGFSDQLYKQFLELASLSPPAAKVRTLVLVNLLNGTFEIGRERHLRPAAAADFLTHQLPFAYAPAATAPRWQAFLDRVLPDAASQQVVAEYLGYVFVAPSQLKLEKVLLLHGSGANGKSVFFEVVTALLGPENVSNYSLNSLTGEPAYSRAHLATKLVNYASELNGRLEADTFKQLVSGEPVEARLPYGQPFILTDYAKLIFNCNELPTEVEQTHAFFRRFLIVPFSVTIPETEQDKQLAATIIQNELAGVFNWILAGLGRVLAQQGFTDCEAARQQLDLYKLKSDTVKLYLNEYEYKASAESCLPTAEVYSQYRQFCLDYGHRYPVTRLKFVDRLSAVGIVEQRRKMGRVLFLSRPL